MTSRRKRILIALGLGVALALVGIAFFTSSQPSVAALPFTGKPCGEHGVADSLCSRCHPDLIPMFKSRGDWCVEHKLPESQCYLCHPELAKTAGVELAAGSHDHGETESDHGYGKAHNTAAIDWCTEHRVPESQCTRCRPELVMEFKAKGDWCAGHGIPESHCYLCNPGLKFPQETEFMKLNSGTGVNRDAKPRTSLFRSNAGHCATDDKIIQLASVETASRAGLVIGTVEPAVFPESVEGLAEIEFDATSSFAVTSLVSGTLVRWVVQPGEAVKRGRILAYLESIEGATMKADFVHAAALHELARNAFEREKSLTAGGMSSLRELQEKEAEYLRAQADLKRAAAALKAIGYTSADLERLPDGDDRGEEVPLRAGKEGILVEQRVELGAVLTAGTVVGLISNPEEMWAEMQLRERELPMVRVGQSVVLTGDGNGLQRCVGVVSWVADAIDPQTRMGRVRILIPQNEAHLRAHQFVSAQIDISSEADAVTVSQDAVQWEGCCNVVFVAETRDRFRPRKVSVLYGDGKNYTVHGLEVGERVVTKGSYLLKTELMKGSLGAGCCGAGA